MSLETLVPGLMAIGFAIILISYGIPEILVLGLELIMLGATLGFLPFGLHIVSEKCLEILRSGCKDD